MKIAVVTGASSGIGREFVRQIDDYGFDEIWGIALEEDKLLRVKEDLKTHFRYFAADLTDEKTFEEYESALKQSDAEIKLLVNCSGFGKFGRYNEIPLSQSLNMIDLNCKSLVRMTETSLSFMKENARIVQIASVAGFQPIPYLNVYGATKAFVISYSRALNVELKHRKISVTTVCPFWTKTEFFARAKETNNNVVSKYIVMYDAHDVVKKALRDARRKKEISIYGFVSRAQVRFVKMMPHKLIMKVWCRQQKLEKKYK